jgi:hypothetical protein
MISNFKGFFIHLWKLEKSILFLFLSCLGFLFVILTLILLIPDYNLKLSELPLINSMKLSSSELIASTSNIQNLN